MNNILSILKEDDEYISLNYFIELCKKAMKIIYKKNINDSLNYKWENLKFSDTNDSNIS